MRNIYLAGALRNPQIPLIANQLRQDGHRVFDEWYAVGPEADEKWREYSIQRGHTYIDALASHHARDVYNFDRNHILSNDTMILILPAGRSGHLELGFASGKDKDTHILLDQEYDRWDVMYLFANHIWSDINLMKANLRE